ncbi:hypothetical protein SAMN02910456_00397 [Ruminococcaceae bacterium YRB3002]|nr:hypothetical protein SAMN02910456_00397 [Ruminococcaceae bacterium YRB3002]
MRKRVHNNTTQYDVTKDVGLYVISDDNMLIENVNNTLKRKGIIGVTDSAGSTRYYLDGRDGLSLTSQRISDAVSALKDQVYDEESAYRRRVYDLVAQRIFMKYDVDLSYIGSSIMYSMVRDTVESNFKLPNNLKDLWALSDQYYGMSYQQMVRNVRYAVSKSVLGHMRSRAAISFLAIEIMTTMRQLKLYEMEKNDEDDNDSVTDDQE